MVKIVGIDYEKMILVYFWGIQKTAKRGRRQWNRKSGRCEQGNQQSFKNIQFKQRKNFRWAAGFSLAFWKNTSFPGRQRQDRAANPVQGMSALRNCAVHYNGRIETVLLSWSCPLAEGKRLSARHLSCRTGQFQKNTGLFQDQVLREHEKFFPCFPISHGRRILLLPGL